jgi:hypothetical protein
LLDVHCLAALAILEPPAGRCRQRFAIPSGELPEESHRVSHGFERPSHKTGLRLVRLADQNAVTPMQVPESRHQVLLSERGIQLVEAWMAVDERKYIELVNTTASQK